jgi:hypothetical protein
VKSGKSPRHTMSKKSGKSLKDKRADKRVKAALHTASTEATLGRHAVQFGVVLAAALEPFA